MHNIDVSIIIVSWNVKHLLKQCLNSIFQNMENLKVEIIVVDNASHDGSAQMIAEEYPDVVLIANKENAGFAKANNQALMRSHGDYLLLLNPDTIMRPGNLNAAVRQIQVNPKIGILGCKTLNPDLTLQPSVRKFPTFWPIFLILTKIAKILPRLKALNEYFAVDFDYSLSQPVDQVAGSYMLITRRLIDEVGLFDENFFYWFEEVDLCQRAYDGGWLVYYDQKPEVIHYGGQSFKQEMTLKKQLVFFQSAWYYFKKHGF